MSYRKNIIYAGILMIIALVTGMLAMIRPTPLVFLLFFLGIFAAAIAILLYLYAVIKDLKTHKVI